MTDPVFRQAAGEVALRCTVRQGVVLPGMMRGLLEYVSQQLMTNKNWTFQLSALEILAMIVRMKLPTLSGCILNQYLDMALDVSINSPTAIVKLGALSLLGFCF
jgi:tetrahydromethanopterin S-methyltransferase subunit C